MQDKLKSALNSAGFCAALALFLLLVGVGGYYLFRPEAVQEAAPPAETAPPAREIVLPPRQEPIAPTRSPAPMPSRAPAAAPQPLPEEPPEPEEESGPPAGKVDALVVWPLHGSVLAAFSADELQYSETLGDWRVHEGMDIAAKPGTTVLAASAGTVVSVEADPMMGTTVTISHDGGCETRYSNLQAQPPVAAGDEVSAGQIIGAVGDTAAAEAAQPPHLHFSVSLDGTPVDPEEFLNA